METTKHACMLPKPPQYDELHPNANCWQRMRYRWRNLLLPCDWHYGTLVFIRSRKSLDLERQRQLATAPWFIWHPYSPANFYFNCLIWVANFLSGIYFPLQVFFICPNPADWFILMTDFLTFCNSIVIFCSGYNDEDSEEIVLDPRKLALNYLKGSFLLDFISALPFQLYQPFSDCRYPSHTVFLPIKLLRYPSNVKRREAIMEQLNLSYSLIVLTGVLIRLLAFFNWMTYWQYQVPVICVHFYDMANLGKAEAQWLKMLDVNTTANIFVKYITNLFFVCGRCFGLGYPTPVGYHVMAEMIQNGLTEIVSLIFLIHCFLTVLRLVLCSQSHYFIFDGAEKELEKYMTVKRLPRSLQHKIRLFINYKFGRSYTNETAILNTINNQIKQDINMHTCRRLVITVPLFKGLPMALINTLIFNLKQEVYVPEQVTKRGQKMDCMYFIYYGTVAIMNEHGTEIKHLKDGAYFGEAAILNPEEPAPATVIALEITEIYALMGQPQKTENDIAAVINLLPENSTENSLKAEDFKACIQHYPQILERMSKNNRRTLSRQFPRPPY